MSVHDSTEMPSSDDLRPVAWPAWPFTMRGRRRGSGATLSSTTTTTSASSRLSSPYSATTLFFSGPLGVLLLRCLITAMAYDKKFVIQL